MAPLSYARATASSNLRSSPYASPSKTSSTPAPTLESKYKPVTKKLKRPSTVTPEYRQSLKYKSDLYPINPLDATKPCHLANLPSELRTAIYEHVLSATNAYPQPRYILKPRTGKLTYIWPTILHVSRGVRIEAAYVFYTTTAFSFTITNLNFAHVKYWLDSLPSRHRALLARNRGLSVTIVPVLKPTHTYPPAGWLLDAPLNQQWKACAQYGNLYGVATAHRESFILFCRLVSWFHLNDAAPYSEMRWKYHFERVSSPFSKVSDGQMLLDFACKRLAVLVTPQVVRAWRRGKMAGRGKSEASAFLGDLEDAFQKVNDGSRDAVVRHWERWMARLKEAIEKW